jgi:transcriptional regulator with XRE-family HTH domain
MNIENLNSDEAVLGELGKRLARTRLERNVSQATLAVESGVSKSTIERLEAGRDVQLGSFIRVLRSLGLLERLDRLVPTPLPSPIERIKLHGRQRRRAQGRRGRRDPGSGSSWTWVDETTTSEE